jgi:hypothetical protein
VSGDRRRPALGVAGDLAEHDAGLVPIADPDRFQRVGWWIAITRDDRTRDQTAVAVLA